MLKLQHLEEFILKSRNELEHWWKKCHYGNADKQTFAPFYSNDFSEELLERHEQELEKIRKHYNDNAPLFAMVTFSKVIYGGDLNLYYEKSFEFFSRFKVVFYWFWDPFRSLPLSPVAPKIFAILGKDIVVCC